MWEQARVFHSPLIEPPPLVRYSPERAVCRGRGGRYRYRSNMLDLGTGRPDG